MADAPQDLAIDTDMFAALIRGDLADLEHFLELLAEKLERGVPGAARVERKGLFAKRVHAVHFETGAARLSIEQARSGLRATRAKLVRGVAIRTEELVLELWVNELAASLSRLAEESASARAALTRLVMGK
jgi:hypothetical protein